MVICSSKRRHYSAVVGPPSLKLRWAGFTCRDAAGEGWWEVLVTLQSSLPVYFATSDLQSDNWITSRKYCLNVKSRDILCAVKIHTDKIEGGPPHALSRRDVRLIIQTVPPDWTTGIKEIRISNSLDWYSRTFFTRYDGCLTIYSRNKTKERALDAVLSELVAISLGLPGSRYRSKADRNRLSKMAAGYKRQLLPLITSPTHSKTHVTIEPDSKVHVSLEGFQELLFPLIPTDSE